MSNYTTELRFICESYAGLKGNKGFNDVDNIISKTWKKIFDFDFPIFDEAYRETLCSKIIRHYYTREICAETVGRWKLFLQAKMNEIMPYYNQLYKSELLIQDPFKNTDYQRIYTKDNTENTDSKNTTEKITNGTNNSTVNDVFAGKQNAEQVTNTTVNDVQYLLHSDTPQGGLKGVDDEEYLTTADKNKDNTITDTTTTTVTTTNNTDNTTTNATSKLNENGTNNTNTDKTGKEEFTESIIGKTGSQNLPEILKIYRETFINVDTSIINELRTLFMMIW